jgi:SlyX protein
VNTDERLIDIEIKLTRQEDSIDELNQTVYRQQRKIDELEQLLVALAKRVQETAHSSNERSAANERPPHY